MKLLCKVSLKTGLTKVMRPTCGDQCLRHASLLQDGVQASRCVRKSVCIALVEIVVLRSHQSLRQIVCIVSNHCHGP